MKPGCGGFAPLSYLRLGAATVGVTSPQDSAKLPVHRPIASRHKVIAA